MLDKLTERLRKLQLENVELVKENAGLKTELLNLRCTQEGGEADANPGDDTEERLSEEAARKRLERICKRKGDGIGCVQVSTEVAQCGFPIGFLLAAVLVDSRGLQLGPDTCSGN